MVSSSVSMLSQICALEAVGLKVISATEAWVERDDDDMRPILLGFTSGVAETELRKLSRRTKAGLKRAREQGKVLGRPIKPTSLVLKAARLVRGEGLSLRAAVRRVNHGVPKKPEQPGGLCQISVATLNQHLNGTWKGSQVRAVPRKQERATPAAPESPEDS
jgi:DNA invertase Pin-like site-specific DNA recombinase